jgi:hypothetical protein
MDYTSLTYLGLRKSNISEFVNVGEKLVVLELVDGRKLSLVQTNYC